MNSSELRNQPSNRATALLALVSLMLGGGALWFTWFRYESLRNQLGFYWYNWIQLGGIALLGALCLWAGVLFLFGKPSGWSAFRAGLSIIPLILFFNLIILVYRGIQNLAQANANLFFERLLHQPQKVILVLVVLIFLTLFASLTEKKTNQ